MKFRPVGNIIQILSFAWAFVPQRGPKFENLLACKAGREERNV